MQGEVERAYFSETVKWYLNSKFYSRNKNLRSGRSKPVLYHPCSGKSWGCFCPVVLESSGVGRFGNCKMWYRQECWWVTQLLRAILIKECVNIKSYFHLRAYWCLLVIHRFVFHLFVVWKVLFLSLLSLSLEFTFYRWWILPFPLYSMCLVWALHVRTCREEWGGICNKNVTKSRRKAGKITSKLLPENG